MISKILKIFCAGLIGSVCLTATFTAQKRPAASAGRAAATKTLTIVSEPQAAVWIDDVFRGKTDESGKLLVRNISSAAHRLRVRAAGFSELNQNLTAAQKGEVKVALIKTTDEAELLFQQAEAEKNKSKAVALYRRVIALRPKSAEIYVAIARLLTEENPDEALTAISEARKIRPIYPEASAVEGRIYNSLGEESKAVSSFKRAISEGKGYQPEANTGLGLLYRDKAEGLSDDLEKQGQTFALAAGYLTAAIKQLAGAPDAETIMQLLGGIYEKTRQLNKAVALYQEFLRLFPESSERSAIESFIVQLKKEMQSEQP